MYIEDNEIVLEILDYLNWEQDFLEEHWKILTAKIDSYVGYLYSGQLDEKYKNRIYCIKVVFTHEGPEVAEKYLKKFKELLKEYGYNMAWMLYKYGDNVKRY